MPFLDQLQKSTAYESLKWIKYPSKISEDTTDQKERHYNPSC